MRLALIEPVPLNGTTQWIRVQSASAGNSALAAASRPDLVRALATAGMDVSGPEAAAGAYDFALAAARERGHARALRQLRTTAASVPESLRDQGPLGGKIRRSLAWPDLRAHRPPYGQGPDWLGPA